MFLGFTGLLIPRVNCSLVFMYTLGSLSTCVNPLGSLSTCVNPLGSLSSCVSLRFVVLLCIPWVRCPLVYPLGSLSSCVSLGLTGSLIPCVHVSLGFIVLEYIYPLGSLSSCVYLSLGFIVLLCSCIPWVHCPLVFIPWVPLLFIPWVHCPLVFMYPLGSLSFCVYLSLGFIVLFLFIPLVHCPLVFIYPLG